MTPTFNELLPPRRVAAHLRHHPAHTLALNLNLNPFLRRPTRLFAFAIALVLFSILGLVPARAAAVTSSLPAYFTPGLPFTVTLTVAPDAITHVYALEETPPTNWVVSAISHGGAFDAAAGKVKWGPFVDALPRALSYQLAPAAGAAGTNSFSGRAIFDDTLVPVGGIRSTVKFPGTLTRTSPPDYLPGLALPVTLDAAPAADVGAWAVEELVPIGWSVTGISDGGGFDAVNHKVKWGPFFDTDAHALTYLLTSPVTNRTDVTLNALARFDAATLVDTAVLPLRPSRLARSAPATYLPAVPFTVTLTATPAPYVQTFALEEALPDGWVPSDVSAGGVWDATNRKLKWGPFAGSDVVGATFSYGLTPAAGAAQPLPLAATARFDEAEVTSAQSVNRFLLHSENAVVRTLPAEYRPGQPLTVTLAATPIDTGLVYAIEESVPTGWTVAGISHGGVFDTVNRLVKWGPFFDATATSRTLTYQATPPAEEYGAVTFTGTARFDQSALDITGATELPNAPGTVQRGLPGRYLPGVPFSVTLNAIPVPGVVTYAVEEVVPAGWTVSALSDGGAFDARNQKLKWGPFLDRDLRPLTYTVTPPTNALGTNTFTGQALFNGEAAAIGGTNSIALDHAPVAVADALDRPLTAFFRVSVFALLANDTDADSDFLNVTAVGATSVHGGDVELDWPWIYYTPPVGFSGIDAFTYTLNDGFAGTASATVTLTPVLPPGSPALNIVSLSPLPGGVVRVRFTGVPSFVYHVEVSPDAAAWTRVADLTASNLGQFEFEDAAAGSFPVRFYRTVWP